MSVRFKFANELEHHSVPCDGLQISVRDLKRAIVRQNKLGKITDFDLIITGSDGTKYDRDDELISKNTSVIVKRSPLTDGKKKVWEEDVLGTSLSLQASSLVKGGSVSLNITSLLRQGEGGGTEEDRIESMITNSTEMYRGEETCLQIHGCFFISV